MLLLAAATASALLFLLGAVHLYWACGGVWPGSDEPSLARHVLGGKAQRMPPRKLTFAIGAVLLVLAYAPLAVTGQLAWLALSAPTWRTIINVFAGVLVLRGAFGLFEQLLHPAPEGTPYVRLNLVLYSPLALVIGISLLVTAH